MLYCSDQNKLVSYLMELMKMIIQQTCIQIFHTRHLKANKMSVFHIDAWAWLARNIEIIELRARITINIKCEHFSFIMCWFWVSKFPALHRRFGPFIYGTVFGSHHISHGNYSDANNVTHENLICFCYWTERVVNTQCANRL